MVSITYSEEGEGESKQRNVKFSVGDAECTVNLWGCTVTSWKCKGKERLFVSSKSLFDNKKAIRGGIPMVFPNFGPWDLGPQHGFARITMWEFSESATRKGDDVASAIFTMTDTEESRKMWPFQVKLICIITLKDDSFSQEFIVDNIGEVEFDFTSLLHTYLKVDDVKEVGVTGFTGCEYVDKADGGARKKEENEVALIQGYTDRMYIGTQNECVVTNTVGGDTVVVQMTNFPDTENAKKMGDFGDEEYPFMVCVEPGYVSKRVVLGPQQSWQGSQTLTIRS
eukprot:Nk52_evm17s1992 gene=Nk52_evmTU17s1992